MRILMLFLLITLALNACAAPKVKVLESSTTDLKIGTIPKIGEKAQTPVGGVMLSQFKYWSKTGYRLRGDLNTSFKLGRVSVSDGDLVMKAEVDHQVVFCSEKLAYIDPLVGPWRPACFIDFNNDGEFEKLKVAPGVVWFESDIAPPLAYEKGELLLPHSDAFRYELLYQGTSKGSLKLLYREYLNDLARPAFFQEVTYELASTPSSITFRTVHIEVLSADNNGIIYRVLRGF